MDNLNGKWALVTGASSGFGIEFATLLAEQNANLILAARRTGPMTKLAQQLRQKHNVTVVVEGIDLSVVGAGAELKSRLDRRGITVDVLVNNAGCGLYGNFVDQPLEKILGLLQLNVLAITELTHIFAADMVARRSGHILLVASLLGYEATPGYAAYAASKGYVLLFGEALHAELKPHGVGVTVLSPGATATSFGKVAGQKNTAALNMLMMEPRPVARTGILAMLHRRSSVVAGILNKLVVFVFRFAPRQMQRAVMQKVMSGA
jgi:short-subunit dehydrogenase